MKLTPKQQRFVAEYLVDLNATQAAVRAGYSLKTAKQQGSRLLTNVDVEAALQAANTARQERTEITQDRVLKEYAKLAFLDPRRFYSENGSLIPVQDLPADVAAALSSMEIVVSRSGTNFAGEPEYEDVKKIRFADKKAALDSIARHLGMFTDKTELSGANGGPIATSLAVTFVKPNVS